MIAVDFIGFTLVVPVEGGFNLGDTEKKRKVAG